MLLLVMHHIVSDGWSLDVLFGELQALYRASRSGRPANLPELPVQYADYVVWQRQRLHDDEALQRSMQYWREQLADAPAAAPNVPTDRLRPSARTPGGGARQELRMPASLLQGLRALCRQQDATLFMALLTAWATLLHRYSGEDDILIGTNFANRNRGDVESLIGFFSTPLILRHDLAGDPSFTELLGRVRETTLDAFSHGDLPLSKLIETLYPLPLPPQISFELKNATRSSLKLDGLEVIERIQIDRGVGKVRFLQLTMIQGDDGLTGGLEYNTDLFEANTIIQMLRHFRILLEGILARPEQRISKLPLITETERQATTGVGADAQQRGLPARPGRAGGWPSRFRRRLRRASRRARRAAVRHLLAGVVRRDAGGRVRRLLRAGKGLPLAGGLFWRIEGVYNGLLSLTTVYQEPLVEQWPACCAEEGEKDSGDLGR
jgi:hypothetical protein